MKTFKQLLEEATSSKHHYWVTDNKGKITHGTPFKDESSALIHGDGLATKKNKQHPVYKVDKNNKIVQHLEIDGGYYSRVRDFQTNHHEKKHFDPRNNKLKPVWDD